MAGRLEQVLVPIAVVVGASVIVGIAWFVLVAPDLDRFRASSEAMVPTIKVGDRFTVNKGAYDEEAPGAGDIVVFHSPMGAVGGTGQSCGVEVTETELCSAPTKERSEVTFVKRIVAGPGDLLEVRDGRTIVNGKPRREPYIRACGGGAGCTFDGEMKVPDGHFFMLGDNRGQSDDSRFWGPVPRKWFVGRVETCDLYIASCSPLR